MSLFTAPALAQTARGLHPSLADSAILAGLPLRNIGPASVSGRISDIDVARMPGERLGRVVYAASAAGGVWKTENGGKTWQPITDSQPIHSVGDVTVAPSNPNIVWVGTGESNNLRSSSWGHGVYKSVDAGRTWVHMGLRTSQHVPRILIHPTNPDIVYVAAMGPLWTSGGERGVYKTTDGGRNWTRVLVTNETTGAHDLIFDPTNPDVIYAATMQRERKAYSFVAGGPESGIYKSTNAGASWTRLTRGLPAGDKGRIGLDISLSQPRILYAYVHADSGGVFRSDDGGENWTRQSNRSSLPWFTGQVRVDTKDPNRVYHIGQSLGLSTDAARTWRNIANATHADFHAMWIDPNDPNYLIAGNDGGLYFSYDKGETWDFAVNMPISTFYAIGVDMREPYYVYGGLQDNGSWGAPTATRRRSGINNFDWINVGGGDGFYTVIDPTDPFVMYSESQGGAVNRVDVATDERKSIRPPNVPGETFRFNWSAPLVISKYSNQTLYFGGNFLFKSTDRGDTWTRLGGDLTRALNRDTLPIMGLRGPGGLGRHDGVQPFGNIATISESPIRQGLLYVGTDDGVIQVTRDDGQTWTRFDRFAGVPDLTYVSRVVASAHNEGTVYATLDGHRSNDFRPYVLKSTDFGRTWSSIASNLPQDASVQVIREHHRNPNLLFVGTENGVFASTNGGASWTQLRLGMAVPVHDLIIHPRDNDLVVGSHGRGIFILDDMVALERLAEAAANAAQVFPVRSPIAFNPAGGPGSPGHREYFAPNPPQGAIISYVINRPVPQGASVRLTIVDTAGQYVRELALRPEPGLHRVTWDLRFGLPQTEPPRPPAAAGGDEDEGFGFGAPPAGPYVSAGTYTAQLRIVQGNAEGGVVSQTAVRVRRDPMVRLTEPEWAELNDARARAFRVIRDANTLVQQLEQAKRTAPQSAAALDSAIVRLRGAQPAGGPAGQRGGGGGGGRGGGPGGGAQSVIARAQAVANQVGTAHFRVTAQQRQDLAAAEQEFARQRTAAEAALQRARGGQD
jgi:photosystem II stability/assembly factor-like uncharacterized protein